MTVYLIKKQRGIHFVFYALFGIAVLVIMMYYLSDTLIHFTTPRQFPINSFTRFPLTILIFPAELFSFFFALYFVYTLFTDKYRPQTPQPLPKKDKIPVAILLPVYNEPKEIVERTVKACKNLKWKGGVNIYLLDDSTSDKDKENMYTLAKKYKINIVRKPNRIGYKAGNLNNAINKVVREDYFVVLDSDQAPEPEFLEETMDYFSDSTVAFVQTPQHFIKDKTPIDRAAKIGTNIFYRAQCLSKARDGAIPFCGTNAVIRTDIFRKVNGFSYYTATEDIELGLRMNAEGYKGAYVPKILVHGYAPPNFKAYASQQYRWANGNLAILRESWAKILGGNFSLRYQIHTFFTLGWWLVGLVVLIYILVPLLSVAFGIGTHHTWLPTAILIFLFFNVVLGISMIYASLHARLDKEKIRISDALLQYSLIVNSMFIYIRAAINALLFKRYIGFVRTQKKGSASSLWQIKWNLLLSAICFGFSIYALYYGVIASDIQQLRTYLPLSLWLLFYSVILASSILFVGNTGNKNKLLKKNKQRRIKKRR